MFFGTYFVTFIINLKKFKNVLKINKMNKIISTTIILSLFILVVNCSSNKKTTNITLQEQPPFKVLQAHYSWWAGGQPGVKGYKFYVEIDNSSVELYSVFFRGRTTSFKKISETAKNDFSAVIMLPNDQKDYNLNIDSKKEFGNTPPSTAAPHNFQLKNNEAILRYIFNNNAYYTKITNVAEITSNSIKPQ